MSLGSESRLSGSVRMTVYTVASESCTCCSISGNGAALEEHVRAAFDEGLVGTFIFAYTDDWNVHGYQIDVWGFGLTKTDLDDVLVAQWPLFDALDGAPLMMMRTEHTQQLRRDLGNLMRQFGEAFGDLPPGLGQAEQAMRDAVDALNQPNYGNAAEAQNEALNQLQQGMQAAQQMMQRQMGTNVGPGQREQMDPLGRTVPDREEGATSNTYSTNSGDDLDTSGGALERARSIFEELRDRRNAPARPKEERDYLDRLLKQF